MKRNLFLIMTLVLLLSLLSCSKSKQNNDYPISGDRVIQDVSNDLKELFGGRELECSSNESKDIEKRYSCKIEEDMTLEISTDNLTKTRIAILVSKEVSNDEQFDVKELNDVMSKSNNMIVGISKHYFSVEIEEYEKKHTSIENLLEEKNSIMLKQHNGDKYWNIFQEETLIEDGMKIGETYSEKNYESDEYIQDTNNFKEGKLIQFNSYLDYEVKNEE